MGQQYSHLSSEERILIEKLHCEQHLSIRRTAERIGRDKSTVSRELRRGLWFASNENGSYRPYRPKRLKTGPWTSGPFYSALAAQRKADLRRRGSRKPRRMDSDRLRAWVLDSLRRGWSPELIEGRLKAQYAGDPSMRISHECLYQWIYAKPQRALDLRQYLARGRKRRTRKKGRKAKGPRIPMRVPIADRPEAVGSRKGFGHFESDTVVGAAPSRRCMNTQVERRSRRLFARLVDDKSASATARAEYEIFKDMPPAARVDRTWDNGTEASLHMLVDEALGMLTYFADPYSSWQRGSNENRNGRIRRYLPKGTSFEDLTQDELDAIVGEINDTPMKLLGYKTPNEVWDEEIARLQSKAASPNTSVALSRTRKKGRKAKGPRIPMRVPIADRPEAVGSRKGFGHFESDTVVGAAPSRRCMNTQVERRSRRLFARLVDDKSASATARAEYEIFKDMPPAARVDRTWDNGTEASLHMLVDEALGMLTYFADPYSSWQRGSNENRNGRIRRYLPKGTSFEDLTQDELDAIVGEINDTPMKLLGYKTPNEVWDEEIARLQSKAASPNTSVALTN